MAREESGAASSHGQPATTARVFPRRKDPLTLPALDCAITASPGAEPGKMQVDDDQPWDRTERRSGHERRGTDRRLQDGEEAIRGDCPDGGAIASGEAVPRTEARKPIAMQGAMKNARGARQDVTVADLSASGCRIESLYLRLEVGENIFLRPEGLEGRACTVIWCNERAAGIKFDTPFHPAVLDNLCRLHGAPER